MLISADQIVIHLFSDFFLQNDWMATNKKNPGKLGTLACGVHCLSYTLPFLLLTTSPLALLFIFASHFIIDRTYLVSRLIWAKNQLGPKSFRCPWETAKSSFGFHPSRVAWISCWIGIIVDNTFHIVLNGLAVRFF